METELIDRCIRAMWKEYSREPEPTLRACLLEFYFDKGLIHKAARDLAKALPRHVDGDDLVSAGTVALLKTMERFDPRRGVRFETFCHRPIRGAMIDYLRKIDPLSRGKRHQISHLLNTRQALHMELGRAPSEVELQQRLRISPDRLARIDQIARQSHRVSIDARSKRRSEDARVFADQLCAPVRPWSDIARNDIRQWITRNLSRRDRLIIILYYYENLSMKEIGQVLDLSEARVSQLHKQIIQQLRERLHNRSEELIPSESKCK